MNIRTLAFIGLLALSCAPLALAEDATTPPANGSAATQVWGPGMMGGGWGASMMDGYGGRGYGPGMMGSGWGAGMMSGCGGMGYGMGYGRGRSGADYDTYVDGRIAFLKAELKITDAQAAVWEDYADAVRADSQVMIGMHKQMFDIFRQGDRSVLKMLDFRIRAMQSRLAALEALKPATEALYKALSTEQRARADDIFPAMGCM